jgi:hypothetical protein
VKRRGLQRDSFHLPTLLPMWPQINPGEWQLNPSPLDRDCY